MNLQVYDVDFVIIASLTLALALSFDKLLRIAYFLLTKSIVFTVCFGSATLGIVGLASISANYRYVSRKLSEVFGSGVDYVEYTRGYIKR